MSYLRNKIPAFVFLFALSAMLSSCHERGCTDPKALNYNITADQDDGSCILCNSVQSQIGSLNLDLIDQYWSSPHYNDTVARFHVTQKVTTPSDKLCGSGLSEISLTIQSLVNQEMYMYYHVQVVQGPVYFGSSMSVVVPAYQTVDMGVIYSDNFPPFLSINLDSASVTTNNQIMYY